MSRVAFQEITKTFGDVVAVDDLSLEIPDGEFMVLVGPSGSGKTTALRILAGLEFQSSGHVVIGERIVDRVEARDRDIAMVFQDYALYPQMSVKDNLSFGLKVRRVRRAEIDERVGRTAETLGLHNLLKRKPGQLSGGQRQRVALGRALVREPQVFLMDEPLSNLDALLRAETRGEIKRLQQSIGTTTVYVTHDQVEAMTMGDRIAVMRDGRLEQVGDPRTIYERPTNAFVAAFIGSPAMKFGRFRASSSNGTLALACGRCRLTVNTASEAPADVLVGVRPEHARLWTNDSTLVGPLEGRVLFEEALGRETLIGVEVDTDLRFVVVADGLDKPRLGEIVRFGFIPGNLYLFETESERLLTRV
jgi:ABC-type sugar transport system ATPase subunit